MDLRFFYDCQTPSGAGNVIETRFALDDLGAKVECQPDGDGSDEANALHYSAEDGATIGRFVAHDTFNLEKNWSPANGWWRTLSSMIDHTSVSPTWGAEHQALDMFSVGNAGDQPLLLSLTLQTEEFNQFEVIANVLHEAWDGKFSHPSGGDNVDPYTDEEWVSLGESGRQYNVELADRILVKVERVNAAGEVVPVGSYDGTLTQLWDRPVELGQLAPNEVAHIRFTWQWLDSADNQDYQGYFFDYSLHFDGTQITT